MKKPSALPELLLFLLLFSFTFVATAQAQGTFISTGNMTAPRMGHTATLLNNGKVLIIGGSSPGGPLTSAELFDPDTGTFTATGDRTTGGNSPRATLLADGRVLVTGDGTAELYDPETGTFTATGHMVSVQVYGQTATLLNSGKVLIAGGGTLCPSDNDGCAVISNPEIYDPANGAFTVTGDYADKSGDPVFGTAGLVGVPTVLLPDGEVLIAGEPTAEIYDPVTRSFRVTGQMTRGRYEQTVPGYRIVGTATLLRNGKVLLAGGEYFEVSSFADAELYDSRSETFTRIVHMNDSRVGHTATLLHDGTVLVAGGNEPRCRLVSERGNVVQCENAVGSTELYDPAADTFAVQGNMTLPRRDHTATLLMDGRILITGGSPNARFWFPTSSAEVYVPSVLAPAPIVKTLRLDRPVVVAGSSYSVGVSGSNLTPQTLLDVRFTSPGSSDSTVVLNWQRGLTATHDAPIGIPAGRWTINGVRVHEIETDHTGSFVPINATITVSP